MPILSIPEPAANHASCDKLTHVSHVLFPPPTTQLLQAANQTTSPKSQSKLRIKCVHNPLLYEPTKMIIRMNNLLGPRLSNCAGASFYQQITTSVPTNQSTGLCESRDINHGRHGRLLQICLNTFFTSPKSMTQPSGCSCRAPIRAPTVQLCPCIGSRKPWKATKWAAENFRPSNLGRSKLGWGAGLGNMRSAQVSKISLWNMVWNT